jgi:type IV pilus assembly protein PilQ
MNFQKKKLGLLVMLATVAGVMMPAEAATKLENVKINDSLASQTRIELQFDGPVAAYQERLQYSPEQLVINLNDAESALLKDTMDLNVKAVKGLKVSQNGENLDVVVGLESLVAYEVSQQGNSLFLTLGNDPRVTAATNAVKTPTIVSSEVKGVASGINRINNVNFKKGAKNEGLTVVTLDNKNAALELQKKGTHLLAKFHGTSVVSDFLAIMDVADYSTPIKSIDISENSDGTVLDFAMYNADFDASFDQNGETVVINVSKKKPTIKANAAPKYNGKLLSLSFQDIPVRNALKILAEEIKINLVMNDSVQGNITVNFDSVPWDQALDTILRVKGLDKRIEDSILLVGKQDELAEYEQKQLEEIEKKSAKEPLITEFIQINYAKAADFVKLISTKDSELSISASNNSNGSSNNSADSSDSLLSSRGTVTVDERTNTLIIKDTEASIANIRRLIDALDSPVEQVVIEARLVTVDESVTEEMGIRWGNLGTGGDPGMSSKRGNSGSSWNTEAGTMMPLPSDKGSGGLLSIKHAGSLVNLDLTLAAYEAENRTEIIASPRVTTTNQKEALIEQGYEIPAVSSALNGATTVEWKKAVLSLGVTPQITPDDSVFLDIEVKQDELGDKITTTNGDAISIATRHLETSVLVGNGETLVLGGIFQQTLKREVYKVPLLGDIPVLGWFFSSTSNSNNKREVLVFITPRIVKEAQ